MPATIGTLLKSPSPRTDLQPDLMPVCFDVADQLFSQGADATEAAYQLANLVRGVVEKNIAVPAHLAEDQVEDWLVGRAATMALQKFAATNALMEGLGRG